MSPPKNPIGFFWAPEECNKDPNCITLTNAASHRLGNMVGTFDDARFSQDLEDLIDSMTIKNMALRRQRDNLRAELESEKQKNDVLLQQRLYLSVFFLIAVTFDVLLICNK